MPVIRSTVQAYPSDDVIAASLNGVDFEVAIYECDKHCQWHRSLSFEGTFATDRASNCTKITGRFVDPLMHGGVIVLLIMSILTVGIPLIPTAISHDPGPAFVIFLAAINVVLWGLLAIFRDYHRRVIAHFLRDIFEAKQTGKS